MNGSMTERTAAAAAPPSIPGCVLAAGIVPAGFWLDRCQGFGQGLDDGLGDVVGVGISADVAGQVA